MTFMNKWLLVALAACSFGISGQAVAATSLTPSSSNYLGLVDPGAPANPEDEALYINALIDGLATFGGQTLTRSSNPCTPNLGGCPDALQTGYLKDDTSPPLTIDVSDYVWLYAKYDGQNYGAVVWYVGNLTEVTIPGGLGSNAAGQPYGLSHWTLFNYSPCTGDCGGEEAPEPGSLALLGAGLAGLALVRRRRRD